MPRIPSQDYTDEWDEQEFEILDDEPRNRHGRRLPREDREWEEQQRQRRNPRRRDDY